jgi:hypothetical protein
MKRREREEKLISCIQKICDERYNKHSLVNDCFRRFYLEKHFSQSKFLMGQKYLILNKNHVVFLFVFSTKLIFVMVSFDDQTTWYF